MKSILVLAILATVASASFRRKFVVENFSKLIKSQPVTVGWMTNFADNLDIKYEVDFHGNFLGFRFQLRGKNGGQLGDVLSTGYITIIGKGKTEGSGTAWTFNKENQWTSKWFYIVGVTKDQILDSKNKWYDVEKDALTVDHLFNYKIF